MQQTSGVLLKWRFKAIRPRLFFFSFIFSLVLTRVNGRQRVVRAQKLPLQPDNIWLLPAPISGSVKRSIRPVERRPHGRPISSPLRRNEADADRLTG